MKDEEIIAVVQAHIDGKQIQARLLDGLHGFSTCTPMIKWNFGNYEYRVKPEPLELWTVLYETGTYSTYRDIGGAKHEAERVGNGKIVHMVEVDD